MHTEITLPRSRLQRRRSPVRPPSPSKVEILKVLGHVLPNGVNRQAVGGGLMVNVTDPKARQVVTQDYIAKQVPSANPEQLLQLQPGANVTKGTPSACLSDT
ncbi:hypothetical protein RAA17_15870 [Komagataeibacter rhaeticus]|nr:hypothetical protein [Komagataeibacter rhaeticus]